MIQPKKEKHSCKTCKYCRSKTTNKTACVKKTYYYCDKTQTIIRDSVFKTNECLFHIEK